MDNEQLITDNVLVPTLDSPLNSVPEGYKQTEVGIIPNDWEISALSEVGNFSKGRGIKRNDIADDGVACIRYGEIYTRYNNYVVKPVSRISETVATYALPITTGDILFAGSGETAEEIGKCVAYLGSEEAYAGGDIVVLRSSGQNSLYLGHLLNHSIVAEQKARYGQGDAVVHISARNLALVKLPLPPSKQEQDAIAAALADVDALIAALDALIAKKRDIKQATMQQLLTGKTRLPGFSGAWERIKVGEIAGVKTGPFGSALHEHDYVDDGTPIITVEHLDEFGVAHTNLPRVSEEDRKRLNVYTLQAGDIVFSRVGSIDRNALIRPAEDGWLFSGRLLRVRPDRARVSSPYLSYHFHSEPFKSLVREVAVGQTMASLNTRILQGIEVVLPCLCEQQAIATVLTDMDAEIAALERRLDKTRQIKQGMMQQLLTGRIRLLQPEQAEATL